MFIPSSDSFFVMLFCRIPAEEFLRIKYCWLVYQGIGLLFWDKYAASGAGAGNTGTLNCLLTHYPPSLFLLVRIFTGSGNCKDSLMTYFTAFQ